MHPAALAFLIRSYYGDYRTCDTCDLAMICDFDPALTLNAVNVLIIRRLVHGDPMGGN